MITIYEKIKRLKAKFICSSENYWPFRQDIKKNNKTETFRIHSNEHTDHQWSKVDINKYRECYNHTRIYLPKIYRIEILQIFHIKGNDVEKTDLTIYYIELN